MAGRMGIGQAQRKGRSRHSPKLSQRYRSNQQFKIDDLIVPLPECRDSIYGNADIGTGGPPVCVVVQTYERE